MDKNGSARGPFRRLSSRVVYQNPWITVREDKVVRPGGEEGVFGTVEKLPGASILPLDLEGNVYLAQEYKYAVDRTTVEVFSGGAEEGESPLEAARRELREELGMTARDWLDLGLVDPFTTIVSAPNHMFLARDLKAATASPDAGEQITAIRVPFADALTMVMRGDITHAASCVLVLKVAKLGICG